MLRPANKPALADAIWGLLPSESMEPISQRQYILDGGCLLHKIPWQHGTTYTDICKHYVDYVTRHYRYATTIYDGYLQELSAKDSSHQRRTGGRTVLTVDFTKDMVMKKEGEKKEEIMFKKKIMVKKRRILSKQN